MNANKTLNAALITLIAVLIVGCDNKPAKPSMPEVNDETCKHESIVSIPDKGMQQEFSSKCLRRGTFKPSEKKSW